MGWLAKSFGLEAECTNCGTSEFLQHCPHCDEIVCATCLEPLVTRNGFPDWMKGRKIKEKKDLIGHIQTYLQKLKAAGGKAHCCKQFVEFRWDNVDKAIKILQKQYPNMLEYTIR